MCLCHDGRSRMAMDPRISIMPGRSTPSFHRPGRRGGVLFFPQPRLLFLLPSRGFRTQADMRGGLLMLFPCTRSRSYTNAPAHTAVYRAIPAHTAVVRTYTSCTNSLSTLPVHTFDFTLPAHTAVGYTQNSCAYTYQVLHAHTPPTHSFSHTSCTHSGSMHFLHTQSRIQKLYVHTLSCARSCPYTFYTHSF